ncbi:hypothetical protein LEL_09061 [Akanthomyces lecanii RCEF 1005]|uniref:Uncharacterized protein n=1 Tax=Akanthomyces lecanii RCEF 1005 TaxID=1081108 RepID=A0A168CV55_CORDF|nr:hypothetical protein LEL_09061 [Akanthomyces lecanii RCEF 1005]
MTVAGMSTERRRRDVHATMHFLERECTPEQLNASRSLATPNGYGELDDAKRVVVHDVTGNEAHFMLDNSAFCYVNHKSGINMEMTDEEIKLKYYPETAEMLQKITGASLVHVFNHLRRVSHGDNPQALGGKDTTHHQAYKVHVDQSWQQVKEHVMAAFGDESMMKQRFQIINVWRPLRQVYKDPLAVTDIRTQESSDLVRIDVTLTDGVKTSNLAVRHNDRQKWYYKHAQKPDEPLVFKQFDSADRSCLGQVLHSAFIDEEYNNGDPRWSIEARALVFYEDQQGIQPEEVFDDGYGAQCDEEKPCSACRRHGIPCTLGGSNPSQDPAVPPVRQVSKARSARRARDRDSPTDKFPYLTSFITKPTEESTPSAWLADLELMHHFTATAYTYLPRGAARQNVWQLVVPRLALEHSYLMHQILAMSAFHMVTLHPDRRGCYSVSATNHQDEAIRGLRQVLTTVNDTNCHAVFATSSLLCIGVFASSAASVMQNGLPGMEDLLEVFSMLRGMHSLLQKHEHIIKDGPLGPILRLDHHQSETALLSSIVRLAKDLRMPRATFPSTEASCRNAAESLVECIEHANASTDIPELRVATTWPIGLTREYIDLLRLHDPAAKVVLSLYCQILEHVGSRYWYLEGWSRGIMSDAGMESAVIHA